jgi:hypothetical protein
MRLIFVVILFVYVKSTDLKEDDNLRILNCYEKRQKVTDCIHREGHWTSTNHTTQYKYPDAIKKPTITQRWGECRIPPPPWVWKVNASCTNKSIPVKAYSPETMCEIINGRNILIVGDSINNEFFHTFLGLAWPSSVPFSTNHAAFLHEATLGNHSKAISNALIVNITCSKMSQNYAISFIRNYYLTTNQDIPIEFSLADSVDWLEPKAWVKTIVQRKIDIIFMNRGAHYKTDDVLMPQLKDTFTYLRKYSPKVQTYFGNTHECIHIYTFVYLYTYVHKYT